MAPINANRVGEGRAKRPSSKGEREGIFQKVWNGLELLIGGFWGCGVPFWPKH